MPIRRRARPLLSRPPHAVGQQELVDAGVDGQADPGRLLADLLVFRPEPGLQFVPYDQADRTDGAASHGVGLGLRPCTVAVMGVSDDPGGPVVPGTWVTSQKAVNPYARIGIATAGAAIHFCCRVIQNAQIRIG